MLAQRDRETKGARNGHSVIIGLNLTSFRLLALTLHFNRYLYALNTLK